MPPPSPQIPDSPARIRVKFLSRIGLPDLNIGGDYLRRFPGSVPTWGRCDFTFDPEDRVYDWLVVYDNLARNHPPEPLACPRQHTLLLTGEPSSITVYGRSFTRQFGHVLTSQEPWALKHPGSIRSQAGLLWYYGGTGDRGSFDRLASMSPPAKTRDFSTVCSTKAMRHTLHAQRLEFTLKLKRTIPALDVFGYGMGALKDKADALDPYKYHLAIENHSAPHHWTEKLSDAFLGYCLPLYFGCTNLDDYFPRESYVWIDIRDRAGAFAKIANVLASDEYERRLPAIVEARRRVLHDYATFPRLARLIEERHAPAVVGEKAAGMIVRSRQAARARNPLGAVVELAQKARRKLCLGSPRNPDPWKIPP